MQADDSGISDKAIFQCINRSSLDLVIDTFAENGLLPIPLKLRAAHAGFGNFLVADLFLYTPQAKVKIRCIEMGKNNSVVIEIAPGKNSVARHIKQSPLKLLIPTQKCQRGISLEISNENIRKVLTNRDFKPPLIINSSKNPTH